MRKAHPQQEQAEDRGRRLGQQNPVEVVRLAARGSIEEEESRPLL